MFDISTSFSIQSNLLLHVTVAKMCLNKAIDNKQQKGGELICGVSSLIFWYESRIRALARMDFKPTRRPGPRSVPPTNLYTSNTSLFANKQVEDF